MSDGVNTAMNAVQALCLDATGSAPIVDPSLIELRNGNHAVLIRGKSGDELVRIGIGAFPSHGGR